MSNPTPGVLFICSGNIFRSMSAEYALKRALGTGANVSVSSAGTHEPPHGVLDWVRDYHLEREVDVSPHAPRRLTADILETASLAVAMSTDHRDIVAKRFDLEIPLFNEVAYGRNEALLDVHEAVEDWRQNMDRAVPYVYQVIDHIYAGMPGFIERMPQFTRPRAEK